MLSATFSFIILYLIYLLGWTLGTARKFAARADSHKKQCTKDEEVEL